MREYYGMIKKTKDLASSVSCVWGCKCKCKCKHATCVKILALALAGSVHLLAYHNLARCDSILFILEEDIEERTVGLR